MKKDNYQRSGRGLLSTLAIAAVFAVVGFMISYQAAKDTTAANVSQPQCGDTCVMLKAEGAQPDSLSVKVGEFVQFNSADGKSHSLSLGKGGEEHQHTGQFTSGEFKADEAWRVQFNTAGTYTFHDHNNPSINVVIVAYQEGADHSIKF